MRSISFSGWSFATATASALAFLVALGAPSRAPAQTAADAPELRVETETHTGVIKRIATDAESRFLVTASDDKTVRVWELPGGRLLRVLRPPIGPGNQGQMYAVALSPDARVVAAAGWTDITQKGIYLFDRETGALVRPPLTGLEDVVNHLAFSPDGRYLAASLWGSHGIRVYRMSDFTQVADRAYQGSSYGVTFAADGRLATTSYDGHVRLYSPPRFDAPAKIKMPACSHPYGVSFSPDGATLAVGCESAARVELLSTRSLSWTQPSPTMTGISSEMGALISVAWSGDGQRLYAGGTAHRDSRQFIRVWQQGGRGPYRDIAVSDNTITDMASLRGERIAFATFDSRWGVLDATGRVILDRAPRNLSLEAARLLVSADAGLVQFTPLGGPPLRFDVARRALIDPAPTSTVGLHPPKTKDSGPEISGLGTAGPKVGERVLTLKDGEQSRSVAIAPSGRQFLLGGDWTLFVFDRLGTEQARLDPPGVPWDVTIAGNGHVAVVALGDGSIRWYRLSQQQPYLIPMLALFVHADRKRWIVWSPSGYYAAAPGAEELVGWHVNRGWAAAADFFSVGQFRAQYYRPDVIERILTALDEGKAIQLANAAVGRTTATTAAKPRAPVVSLLAPRDNELVAAPSLRIFYTVRVPDVTAIDRTEVRLDSRPARPTYAKHVGTTTSGEALYEAEIAMPPQDAVLEVIALDRQGTPSAPAAARLRWAAPRPPAPTTPSLRVHVLAIGIGQYTEREMSSRYQTLRYAGKDADAFTAAIRRQKGGLYAEPNINQLPNPTKRDVLNGLDWLRKQVESRDDISMIFLSGHGTTDLHGMYYFLPADAHPDQLKATGVSRSDLLDTITSLPGKVLLFVDTCKAGAVSGTRKGDRADIDGLVNEVIKAQNGIVIFAASSGVQDSVELPDGNGAFTRALVEGLDGAAAPQGEIRISVSALEAFVNRRVRELTNGAQKPTLAKPKAVEDFAIGIRRRQ